MDQVFITDLVARGIIGVNDWEREQPQDILINIVLFTDLRQAGQSDDVHGQCGLQLGGEKSAGARRNCRGG